MSWLFAASVVLASAPGSAEPVPSVAAIEAPPAAASPAPAQPQLPAAPPHLVANPIPPATAEAFPPLGDETEVLDLIAERYDRYTLQVMIGDNGPFDFLIDTGSQATVLASELADRLGLQERQPASIIGMASIVKVEVARVPDMTVGSRVFDVPVAPLLQRSNIGGADGILGLDSLQGQRVLLNFETQTISVDDADNLGGDRGFEIVVRARRLLGQLVITRAEIDGIRTAVIVDTGAQGSVANLALGRKLRGRDLGETSMVDVNGESLQGQVRLARSLSMGGIRLQNFPIAFADAPPFEALGLVDEPALIIGIQQLKLFKRVAIDFDSRKVLFDVDKSLLRDNDPSRRIYAF